MPSLVYQRFVRKGILAVVAALFALGLWLAWVKVFREPFPSDRTPEGAYLRIVLAIDADRPRDMFAYLETDAEWAAYTIRDARKEANERIRASYPEPERTQLTDAYRAEETAPDGADVFMLFARRRGWIARMRRDLSGVKRVEVDRDRATVVTARGTRYPFRRRDNGIWGLTIFTAELTAEAERASRDLAVVKAAAADYDRAKGD
jgi:hypothetical protein